MVNKFVVLAVVIAATTQAFHLQTDPSELLREYYTVIDGENTLLTCIAQKDGLSLVCSQEISHSKLTLRPAETS
jgi:hypothetical protein